MKTLVLKGENVEEKLAHAEKVLNRIIPKLNERIVGIIPPVPVFFSTQKPLADGTLASAVMPISGKIVAGALFVGKYKEKKAVGFNCSVKGQGSGSSFRFETGRSIETIKPNLPIAAGDVVTISTEEPELIENIHVSLLIEFPVSTASVETRMIDELAKVEDAGIQLDD